MRLDFDIKEFRLAEMKRTINPKTASLSTLDAMNKLADEVKVEGNMITSIFSKTFTMPRVTSIHSLMIQPYWCQDLTFCRIHNFLQVYCRGPCTKLPSCPTPHDTSPMWVFTIHLPKLCLNLLVFLLFIFLPNETYCDLRTNLSGHTERAEFNQTEDDTVSREAVEFQKDVTRLRRAE